MAGDSDRQLAGTGMRQEKDFKNDTAKNFLAICLLDFASSHLR